MEPKEHKPRQWRAVHEAAGEACDPTRPAVRDAIAAWVDGPIDRRQFMRLVEGAMAAAGLQACAPRGQSLALPYVTAPAEVTPSVRHYASCITLRGYAESVIVRTFEGKPQYLLRNMGGPGHARGVMPALQASILDLYDPDRLRTPLEGVAPRTWDEARDAWRKTVDALGPRGEGLVLITGRIRSLSVQALLGAWRQRFPGAEWVSYEPSADESVTKGAALALGFPARPLLRFAAVRRLLALDPDFLDGAPDAHRNAWDFAVNRADADAEAAMRVYAVEPAWTLAGTMADHRLALAPDKIGLVLGLVAEKLGVLTPRERMPADKIFGGDPRVAPWVQAMVDDLTRHRGAAAVTVGAGQPPAVHALAWLVNAALGAVGPCVEAVPEEAEGAGLADLARVRADAAAGRVQAMLLLGSNPVYDAPGGAAWAETLAKVPYTAYWGYLANETSAHCRWAWPALHELESWGDARAWDGAVALMQPCIQPLSEGKSLLDCVAWFTESATTEGHELLQSFWAATAGANEDVTWWRKALRDGFVPQTAVKTLVPAIAATAKDQTQSWWAAQGASPGTLANRLVVHFAPSPRLRDGHAANNPWLQELPNPITTQSWGNAAWVSPATAKANGWRDGTRIKMHDAAVTVVAPVMIVPGQADGAITLPLGYGRTQAGRIGTNVGFNAHPLRRDDALGWRDDLAITQGAGEEDFARAQSHFSMESRRPVETTRPGESAERPSAKETTNFPPVVLPPDLTPVVAEGNEATAQEPAWGMAIDLNRCIGCGACTMACQAENSIPSVGKHEVKRGRIMHWIRVDRYYDGPLAAPAVRHQPLPCMHCEKAPCEYVCPVGATQHGAGGLNEMIYNRCVGTRYCSNNCPYKVRRFNFYHYAKNTPPLATLQRNPSVSVRSRGVMEKCTYCIQRIAAARIASQEANRPLKGEDVTTACAEACPSEAIQFGDVKDPAGPLARWRASGRHYALLAELGTQPRTTYLARVVNPQAGMPGEGGT